MISIAWGTRIITVPKSDLTLAQSFDSGFSSGFGQGFGSWAPVYEYDLDDFRLALKNLEDGAEGMSFPHTHEHNTTVTLGGATYARQIIMVNNYTVTFEDGQYAVVLKGANSNVADVVNVNQVSVRPQNSAGLQIVTQGSGVTEQDKTDIAAQTQAKMDADSVKLAELVNIEGAYSLKQTIRLILAALAGDIDRVGDLFSLKKLGDPSKTRIAGTVDAQGNRAVTEIDVS